MYSLGLVLYEMLTGNRRSAPTPRSAPRSPARRPAAPDPRRPPGVPPGLAHVVERAVERDPDAAGRTPPRSGTRPRRSASPRRTARPTPPCRSRSPPRPRARSGGLIPAIIDDGMSVGARVLIWVLALALGFGGGCPATCSPPRLGLVRGRPRRHASRTLPSRRSRPSTRQGPEQGPSTPRRSAKSSTTTPPRSGPPRATRGQRRREAGAGLVLELASRTGPGHQPRRRRRHERRDLHHGHRRHTLAAWADPRAPGKALGASATIQSQAHTGPLRARLAHVAAPRVRRPRRLRPVRRADAEVTVHGTPA